MRKKRHKTGSLCFDKRRKTWRYHWYEGAKQRSKTIGTKQQYPTKAAAWEAVTKPEPVPERIGDTVQDVIARYEVERMPARHSTARVYRSFLDNHIRPAWGAHAIAALQPRPVELWLRELPLAPKSKTHIRALLSTLVDFAMWAGILPVGVNPISLVRNQGATQKVRRPRSLSAEEFQALLQEMHEPYASFALVSICLGLRVSEALGLRWSDIDWLNARVTVQRGVVSQRVDEVKTRESHRTFDLAPALLERLTALRQTSSFRNPGDWVFASMVKIGRQPISYTATLTNLKRAAARAGLGVVSTHAMRHSYRSWLDAVGAKVTVQQKMMRHSDIRTTLNVYGDVVTDEMSDASTRVSQMAFTGRMM